MQSCNKCGLPETFETIELDSRSGCNICKQVEFKDTSIDWTARKKMLDTLVSEYRGKYDYDCIIPFSGGKDSTFTLYYLVKEYKIKPLVVQFNHGFLRPNVLENNEKTFRKLGVDVISYRPNWKLVKRLMKEALIRKGDFCWHCHVGIFAYPMRMAIKFNVPLIFWGEPSAEYTAYYDYNEDEIETVDEVRFDRFVNLGITAEDMKGMIKDQQFDERDFLPFTYPSLKELNRIKYRSVCLGSYIPWNTMEQSKLISKELNWKGDDVEGMPPDLYSYEKIECWMQGTRDYIKFLKRGYGRTRQMTTLDIRNGRMTLDEANKLSNAFDGKKPHSLELLLNYLDMDENEFNEIIEKTVIPPNKPNFDKIEKMNTIPQDHKKWYREE
tara:strand:- start:398 stop:1546 length:1149 start_codon:yes stop_codon:yes gene_type:complete